MEKFSRFNNKCLSSVGLSFLYQQDYQKGNIVKYFGFISCILIVIHNLTFAITHLGINLNVTSNLVMVCTCSSGAIKILMILLNQKKFWKLNKEINDLAKSLTEENKKKFKLEIKKLPLIINGIFINTVISTHLYNLTPLFSMIFTYLTKGEIHQKLLYSHSYPVDPYEGYFIYFYIYETILSHFYTCTVIAVDGFYMLAIGKISILFKSLGEDLVDIINQYDGKKSNETIEKLNKKVEIHSQLLNLTQEFLSLFEVAMFIYVITFAVYLCCILFNAIMDENDIVLVLPKIMGIFQTGAYLFHFCYFGEKLEESVR
jgi:hypothetical protein